VSSSKLKSISIRRIVEVEMDEYVSYASTLPPDGQLLTLLGIALILGLGKGGVPGLATVATAATVLTAPSQVTGGLGFAVALMVPILTMIDIYAAWLHRTALDWPTVWLLLPTSFVGMIIGQLLDKYLTDKSARLLVGNILLGILVLRTWKDVATFLFPSWAIERHLSGDSRITKQTRKESDDEDEENYNLINNTPISKLEIEQGDVDNNSSAKQRQINKQLVPVTTRLVWACVVGLIGGAATMLTNSMGPILNVYLLSVAGLSPQSYIGTRAMFFCFLNVGKLPLRVIGGTLGRPMLPLAMGLGAVSVLGVFLAKPIMLGMNERLFVRLELSVVAFAGLRLIYVGLT